MRLVACALVIAGLGDAGAGGAEDITSAAPVCARAHCFAVQLHVANDAKGLVVAPAWLGDQLATANKHFDTLDVGFALAGVDNASVEHVVTRADRDALFTRGLSPRTIHVFVTAKLDDIDNPGEIIYGVTWHAHDATYIVVSGMAWERTLAHELGHYFGLPHSTYAISIMNKTPREEPPIEDRRFSDEELAKLRTAIDRVVKQKSVVEIRAATSG